MIVPMKRITVIAQSKDAVSVLDELRSLDVVHLEHQQSPKSEDVSRIKDDLTLINKALEILSEKEFFNSVVSPSRKEVIDCISKSRHIIDLRKRLEQLRDFSIKLSDEIRE